MDQQQSSIDATNWPRLAVITTVLVVSFGALIWICTALMNCKRRRTQPATLPRAYLMPVYVQGGSSHTPASAAPSRSTLVYLLYPAMPAPDYSEDDPLAHRQTGVSIPLHVRTRHPSLAAGCWRGRGSCLRFRSAWTPSAPSSHPSCSEAGAHS
jgi:hypothetical protein